MTFICTKENPWNIQFEDRFGQVRHEGSIHAYDNRYRRHWDCPNCGIGWSEELHE